MIKKVLAIIVVTFCIVACAVAQEGEYRAKSYPDGGVMYDGFFIGDKPTEITRYFPNSRIQSVQKFSQDGSSTIKLYYENATPFAIGGYDKDQKRDGKWIFYGDGGYTVMTVTYKNGLKDGVSVLYFKSGVVMDSLTYTADKLNGVRTQYYDNGQKLAVIGYKNGVPDGEYISYFDTGEIDREGNYVEGKREGVWKIHKADGTIEEYKFKAGKCKKYEDMLRKEHKDSDTDPHIPEPTIDNMM